MNKEWQNKFYGSVGEFILAKMNEKRKTVGDIVKESGQQHNTVKRLLEGQKFMFHHVVWLTDVLDISVDEMMQVMAKLTRVQSKTATMERLNEIRNKRRVSGEVDVSDLI